MLHYYPPSICFPVTISSNVVPFHSRMSSWKSFVQASSSEVFAFTASCICRKLELARSSSSAASRYETLSNSDNTLPGCSFCPQVHSKVIRKKCMCKATISHVGLRGWPKPVNYVNSKNMQKTCKDSLPRSAIRRHVVCLFYLHTLRKPHQYRDKLPTVIKKLAWQRLDFAWD